MNKQIIEIQNKVLNNEVLPHATCLWEGAGLVISHKPVQVSKDTVLVVTEHAQELSDLINALMKACEDCLDYYNKYSFYPELGISANRYLASANDCKGLMLHVIKKAAQIDQEFRSGIYFAYGSNMDETQMSERCQNAKLIGKAVVRGYRFALDSAGTATIVPDKNESVEGLLWSVTLEDIKALDKYEGVAVNCYRRECISVDSSSFRGRALVYISNRSLKPELRRSGYMEKIIRAAVDHGFSESYVSQLQAEYAVFAR